MKFNRQRFMENITNLIKNSKYKVKDVEEAIGVSAGYISRLNKPGNEANLTIEQVATIADMLNVSVDGLLARDYSTEHANIDLVNRFVQQLIRDTDEHKLVWNVMDENMKLAYEQPPMFEEEGFEESESHFKSLVTEKTYLYVKCFMVMPKELDGLFLFRIIDEENRQFGYELYSLPDDRNDEYIPIASSFMGDEGLAKILRELYEDIVVHENDIKLEARTRNSIVNYLRKAAEE